MFINSNFRKAYYKYKDDVGEDSGRSWNRITSIQAGREKTYSTEDANYHNQGVEDLKNLQNEFYNQLMLNRIMSTEPREVKRNLEKEELVLEELEDDELKEILPDWKHPKTKAPIDLIIEKLSQVDKKSILKIKKP